MKKRVLSPVLALLLCLGLCTPALAYGHTGKVGEYHIISAGNGYTAAVDESGALWMWGSNRSGQLGNGGQGNATRYDYSVQTVPVKVMDHVRSVTSDVGSYEPPIGQTAVIKTDGTLWMWGYN